MGAAMSMRSRKMLKGIPSGPGVDVRSVAMTFGGCLKGEGIDWGLESFLELLEIGFLGLAARGGFAPNRLPGILQGCCDATLVPDGVSFRGIEMGEVGFGRG